MLVLLTLSTKDKIFGNENKANDHTQQTKKNIRASQPILIYGKHTDSLGLRVFQITKYTCA